MHTTTAASKWGDDLRPIANSGPDGRGFFILRGAPDGAPDWCVGESWEEMLREGEFHSHFGFPDEDGRIEPARTVAFTADELRAMPAVYAQAIKEGQYPGGGAKIDVNHALASSGGWFGGDPDYDTTLARARVAELRVVEDPDRGAILEGRWLWTRAGLDTIGRGDFVGVSVELIGPAYAISKISAEPFGGWLFDGATLCNDPMIPGMADVRGPESLLSAERLRAASDEGRRPLLLSARSWSPASEGTQEADQMNELLTALGLNADATEAQALTALNAIKASVEVKDATIETLRGERDEVAAARDALRVENETLSEDRYKALTARFVDEGRILPATLRVADDAPEGTLSAFRRIFNGSGSTWDERVESMEAAFGAGVHKQMNRGPAAPAAAGDEGTQQTDPSELQTAIQTRAAELAGEGNPVQTTHILRAQRDVLSNNPELAEVYETTGGVS